MASVVVVVNLVVVVVVIVVVNVFIVVASIFSFYLMIMYRLYVSVSTTGCFQVVRAL